MVEEWDAALFIPLVSVLILDLVVEHVWHRPGGSEDSREADDAAALKELTQRLAAGTEELICLEVAGQLRIQTMSALADLCRLCRRLLIEPTEAGIRLVCWRK